MINDDFFVKYYLWADGFGCPWKSPGIPIEEDLFTLHPLDLVLYLVLVPNPHIPFKPGYLWHELQTGPRNR
jgi:hypothetical protein